MRHTGEEWSVLTDLLQDRNVTLCYSWYIRVNPVTPQSGQHQHFMVKQSVFFFIVSLLPWGGQGLGISGISFNTYNLLPAIPNMWNNIDRISANTNQRCLCSYRHVCANPWTNKSQILLMSSVIFWLKQIIALYCYVYKCLYIFAAYFSRVLANQSEESQLELIYIYIFH